MYLNVKQNKTSQNVHEKMCLICKAKQVRMYPRKKVVPELNCETKLIVPAVLECPLRTLYV